MNVRIGMFLEAFNGIERALTWQTYLLGGILAILICLLIATLAKR